MSGASFPLLYERIGSSSEDTSENAINFEVRGFANPKALFKSRMSSLAIKTALFVASLIPSIPFIAFINQQEESIPVKAVLTSGAVLATLGGIWSIGSCIKSRDQKTKLRNQLCQKTFQALRSFAQNRIGELRQELQKYQVNASHRLVIENFLELLNQIETGNSFSDFQRLIQLFESIHQNEDANLICDIGHQFLEGLAVTIVREVDGSEMFKELGKQKLHNQIPKNILELSQFYDRFVHQPIYRRIFNPEHVSGQIWWGFTQNDRLIEYIRWKGLGKYYKESIEKGNLSSKGLPFRKGEHLVIPVLGPGTFDTIRQVALFAIRERNVLFLNHQSDKGSEGTRTDFLHSQIDGKGITVITLPQIEDFEDSSQSIDSYLDHYRDFLLLNGIKSKDETMKSTIINKAIECTKIALQSMVLDHRFKKEMVKFLTLSFIRQLYLDQSFQESGTEHEATVFMPCVQMADRGATAYATAQFISRIRDYIDENSTHLVSDPALFDSEMMKQVIGEQFRVNMIDGRNPILHYVRPAADMWSFISDPSHVQQVTNAFRKLHL